MEGGEKGTKTERPRMLVRILSKTGGSKRIYIYKGKPRKFRRMEKTTINYASARHNDICTSN